MSPKCGEVGEANSDVAGIGIILSFTIQAGIAIIISFYSYFLAYKIDRRKPDQDIASYKKQLKIANEILLQGGDVQAMTGISLLLTAIIQLDSLPFYHLHIIYDTVSFVGISLCASIVSSFTPDMDGKYIRYTIIALWATLYLAYTALFGTRLRSWRYDLAGHCYDTFKTALPNASHPYVDTIYLAVTCVYVFSALAWALGLIRPYLILFYGVIYKAYSKEAARLRPLNAQITFTEQFGVLNVAALQFPLHVYSIFTLRSSNEPLLSSGGTERQWGFGQIVAMVLLANNVIILLNGIQDYNKQNEEGKSTRTESSRSINKSGTA